MYVVSTLKLSREEGEHGGWQSRKGERYREKESKGESKTEGGSTRRCPRAARGDRQARRGSAEHSEQWGGSLSPCICLCLSLGTWLRILDSPSCKGPLRDHLVSASFIHQNPEPRETKDVRRARAALCTRTEGAASGARALWVEPCSLSVLICVSSLDSAHACLGSRDWDLLPSGDAGLTTNGKPLLLPRYRIYCRDAVQGPTDPE